MANKLFPCKSRYTGPNEGYFTFVHHASGMVEHSTDIRNRAVHIKQFKPKSQLAVRRSHLMYLGPRHVSLKEAERRLKKALGTRLSIKDGMYSRAPELDFQRKATKK